MTEGTLVQVSIEGDHWLPGQVAFGPRNGQIGVALDKPYKRLRIVAVPSGTTCREPNQRQASNNTPLAAPKSNPPLRTARAQRTILNRTPRTLISHSTMMSHPTPNNR